MKKKQYKSKLIDDKIDEWHNSNCSLQLHEFLGMSKEDYIKFVQIK